MVQIGHLFNDIFFHLKLCALQKQFEGAYFISVENSGKIVSKSTLCIHVKCESD